jgi:hypothetical protein
MSTNKDRFVATTHHCDATVFEMNLILWVCPTEHVLWWLPAIKLSKTERHKRSHY